MHEPSSPDLALEAVRAWYESKRSRKGNVNTNVTCVGLAVAELLKKNFPLTDDVVKSEKGSQVRGLSGSMVSRVLKEHGERQEFTSEGGERLEARFRRPRNSPRCSTICSPTGWMTGNANISP